MQISRSGKGRFQLIHAQPNFLCHYPGRGGCNRPSNISCFNARRALGAMAAVLSGLVRAYQRLVSQMRGSLPRKTSTKMLAIE